MASTESGRVVSESPGTPAPRTAREAATTPAPQTGWSPADPGPLGLGAFALTTFVLSMYNAQLVGRTSETVVLSLALAYGGIAQLLAGMWEFRTGNTFGAVAFSSYGAFWISFFVLVQFIAPGVKNPTALDHGIGLYLWAWGIFTTYMFIASLRTTAAVSLVFLLLAPTFIVLGIGNSGSNNSVVKWGGYLGIATAIAAWYASFAAVTNSTFGRTILPVVPLKR
jgi:succinate-acetate transporter protein